MGGAPKSRRIYLSFQHTPFQEPQANSGLYIYAAIPSKTYSRFYIISIKKQAQGRQCETASPLGPSVKKSKRAASPLASSRPKKICLSWPGIRFGVLLPVLLTAAPIPSNPVIFGCDAGELRQSPILSLYALEAAGARCACAERPSGHAPRGKACFFDLPRSNQQ